MLSTAVSVEWTAFFYLIRYYPASIWKMNLVENNTLSRCIPHSIWQCYCIIKSAAAAYASMNPLSLSLSNRDESHSNRAKAYRYWKFWRYLGQAFCMLDNPEIADKYPSLVFSGYIDSLKGEPLTVWFIFMNCCQVSNCILHLVMSGKHNDLLLLFSDFAARFRD